MSFLGIYEEEPLNIFLSCSASSDRVAEPCLWLHGHKPNLMYFVIHLDPVPVSTAPLPAATEMGMDFYGSPYSTCHSIACGFL